MIVPKSMRWAAGAALALALAGCGSKTPSGQVVATVNGEEITLPELNAEAAAANVPENADKKQVMPALLQQVVDRKLFAQEARKRGLDKNSDFIVQRRRAEEGLLAQLLIKPQIQAASVPSPAEITRFMTENPSLFSDRARYTLDQIRFALPPQPQPVMKALADAHSLDQVAARLTQLNVKYERGPAGLDSGTVPPQIMAKIAKLPAGEPFVVPLSNLVTVSVITGKTPVAIPDAQARQLAANLVRQQGTQKTIGDQLKGLQGAAKISYQSGYGPPAAKPALPAK